MNTKPFTTDEVQTKHKIIEAAIYEFEQNGYQGASLRQIVRNAGVTTGAFYGYYSSKAELFEDIVGEHYNAMMQHYIDVQESFAGKEFDEQKADMTEVSRDCMHWMLNYAYDHLREVRLMLLKSEGTRFSDFVDRLVEIEIESTERFKVDLRSDVKEQTQELLDIDYRFEHIMATSMFNAFRELIIHDMTYSEAKVQLELIRRFYTAGWQELFGDIF